ncbi:MAG: lactoylglutathione lyase [Pseudomonadales bacterium]|nr:lactoylglutathione lyase [Pseudomonadales bacterium]
MRLLHTMLRVSDLDKSIDFYQSLLGMTLHRKMDFPSGRFTLAFLGYGDEKETTALELTYNWDTKSYEMGDAFGHIAIAVDDVYKACETIMAKGGEVVREAGPMQHGSTVLAFVKDPDGYMIELLDIA